METLNTQQQHLFDLTNKLSQHQKHHTMTPPTPQLSQDDLVSGLEISSNKNKNLPSNSTGLLSPVSPKQQELDFVSDEEEEINFIGTKEEYYHGVIAKNDVAMMIYQEFTALIYWNIPGRSAIILGSILAALLLTRYYSLLYVCAASLTIATGFNLVFVNFYNWIRSVWTGLPAEEFAHPFHIHLNDHRISSVSRDLVDYYLHKTIDVLEMAAQATARIVYVEDTKTTGVVCLLSASIYFATSIIPTKVFFGLFVLAVFTVPYYYEKNQKVVDEYIHQWMKQFKVAMDKYSTLVRRNSTTMYNNSIALVQQHINSRRNSAAVVQNNMNMPSAEEKEKEK